MPNTSAQLELSDMPLPARNHALPALPGEAAPHSVQAPHPALLQRDGREGAVWGCQKQRMVLSCTVAP